MKYLAVKLGLLAAFSALLLAGPLGCAQESSSSSSSAASSPPSSTASVPATDATATTVDLEELSAVVYMSPTCGCCHKYVEYLKQKGLKVKAVKLDNVGPKKRALGVPSDLWSCHTTRIGRYFVEGHVPFEVIEKLLAEQPDIKGIALPGMPSGSPGMPGPKTEPFFIYAVEDGQVSEFMIY